MLMEATGTLTNKSINILLPAMKVQLLATATTVSRRLRQYRLVDPNSFVSNHIRQFPGIKSFTLRTTGH
jgi:hypothetical protein